ncbi:MAG: hypothetical protein Q8Q09_27580 [Deltaproteobacteria bacterium]|nr:hypothetical protein [Deltaproteobacteria bacterium]
MPSPNALITPEVLLAATLARCEAMGVRIVQKDGFWHQRWIDQALRVVTLGGMRSYMTEYVTTLGRGIFVPRDWAERSAGDRWEVLEHELVHVAQFERFGWVLMALIYLLLPFPMGLAYGRARLEWEAYAVSLRCIAQREGIEAARSPAVAAHMVRRFAGPDYGFMWPFESSVRRWIADELDAIERALTVQFEVEREEQS